MDQGHPIPASTGLRLIHCDSYQRLLNCSTCMGIFGLVIRASERSDGSRTPYSSKHRAKVNPLRLSPGTSTLFDLYGNFRVGNWGQRAQRWTKDTPFQQAQG